MKQQPPVSVVIPSYNGGRFLKRTLRSALGQTHANLEVLVVNDGSPDNTRLVADAVAAEDSRVRVINVQNGGVAKARNIGIEHASGDYIAFLDHDDLWHPAKIELQLARLRESSAGASYTFMRMIDPDDRVVASYTPPLLDGYSFVRHMYARPVGNGSSILVGREAAMDAGGFDASFPGCEDFDFELKLAARYRMVVVPLHLVGYRVSPANMSHTLRLRMARAALAAVEHHLRLHPELPQRAVRLARAATLTYAINNLIADHRRTLAALYFARLIVADAHHALRLAATTCTGKIHRVVGATKHDHADLRHFYHWSPEQDTDCTPDSWQLQDLGQLSSMDAEIGARLGLNK